MLFVSGQVYCCVVEPVVELFSRVVCLQTVGAKIILLTTDQFFAGNQNSDMHQPFRRGPITI